MLNGNASEGLQARAPRSDAYIDKENELRVIRNHVADESRAKRKKFANSRVGVITKILKHLEGGSCLTEKGKMYLDLVMPFIVEYRIKSGKSVHDAVLGWAKQHVPIYLDQVGASTIIDQINATIIRREKAANAQVTSRRDHIVWLPDMEEIVQKLQLTWATGRALKLRGYGYIDPPTIEIRRKHETELRRQSRRKHGAIPQAERTKTKDKNRDAECLGVSVRTLECWIKSGNLMAKVTERMEKKPTDCGKASVSYVVSKYDADVFAQTALEAANDHHAPDTVVHPIVDPVMMEVEETIADPTTVALQGYTGRNIKLTGGEVEHLARKFPRLRDRITDHLERADERMNGTPKFSGNKVLLSLLRYWNKGIGDARHAA